MRKLFFLFLLLLNSSAHALEWPKDLYRIESLNRGFFSPFNTYFEQLKTSFRFQYLKSGFILFDDHDHGHEILRGQWFLRGNEGTIVYTHHSGKRLTLVVAPVDKMMLEKVGSFDFSELIALADFRIQFVDLDYRLEKKSVSQGLVEMEYAPDWGRVYLNEISEPSYLESRLWFRCGECSGEPLLFQMQEVSGEVNKSYFQGQLVEQVTPQKFLQIAYQWYLSSITRQSQRLLERI